jgi:hypothetical protein
VTTTLTLFDLTDLNTRCHRETTVVSQTALEAAA